MTEIMNDLKRRGLKHGTKGGRPGSGGGTGKNNSPEMILKKLMEKDPLLKKLLSALGKKKKGKTEESGDKKTKKVMTAAKGKLTKKEFDALPQAALDNMSQGKLIELIMKFYPEIGRTTDQEYFKMGEGGYRKKGGVMQKAKVGKYAYGGQAMSRTGHKDMRIGGLFKK